MMATRSGGDEVVECSDQDMVGEKGREEGDILGGKKIWKSEDKFECKKTLDTSKLGMPSIMQFFQERLGTHRTRFLQLSSMSGESSSKPQLRANLASVIECDKKERKVT